MWHGGPEDNQNFTVWPEGEKPFVQVGKRHKKVQLIGRGQKHKSQAPE